MARQQPIELFMPPNMLKAKVGGGLGGIDMGAIKRAESAMEDLKSEFGAWLADDIAALVAARAGYAATADAAALLRAAHDIKGQAATFEYPLIACVAASLSRLIAELPSGRDLPLNLVDAHVSAIQVIHRDAIQDSENAMAKTLCAELDARVGEVLATK